MKTKVLIVSVKYSHAVDSSQRIMGSLAGSARCETEHIECLDHEKLDSLPQQITNGNYNVAFIVWDFAFDEELLVAALRLVHSQCPRLKLIAASKRPGCLEILQEAGCVDGLDTGSSLELLPSHVLESIKHL